MSIYQTLCINYLLTETTQPHKICSWSIPLLVITKVDFEKLEKKFCTQTKIQFYYHVWQKTLQKVSIQITQTQCFKAQNSKCRPRQCSDFFKNEQIVVKSGTTLYFWHKSCFTICTFVQQIETIMQQSSSWMSPFVNIGVCYIFSVFIAPFTGVSTVLDCSTFTDSKGMQAYSN